MNMGKYEFISDELLEVAKQLELALSCLFKVVKTDDEGYINVAGDYVADKAAEFVEMYKGEKR